VTQENPLETLQCNQEFLTLGNCDVENININGARGWYGFWCWVVWIYLFPIWQEKVDDHNLGLYMGIWLRGYILRYIPDACSGG
jgi:hypothetical protein